MKFREIVAINGKPGLYKLLGTKSDGAVVRNIQDNVSMFVSARFHTVTALDGIEVFTTEDNMRLKDVLITIRDNAKEAGEFDVAKADKKAIEAYFAKVFPIYDKGRVYASDMLKMIKWSRILDELGLLEADSSDDTKEEGAEQ